MCNIEATPHNFQIKLTQLSYVNEKMTKPDLCSLHPESMQQYHEYKAVARWFLGVSDYVLCGMLPLAVVT